MSSQTFSDTGCSDKSHASFSRNKNNPMTLQSISDYASPHELILRRNQTFSDPKFQKENIKPHNPLNKDKILLPSAKLLNKDSYKRTSESVMMERMRAKFAIADDKLTNSYVHEVQRNYTDKELERELLKYRKGDKRT